MNSVGHRTGATTPPTRNFRQLSTGGQHKRHGSDLRCRGVHVLLPLLLVLSTSTEAAPSPPPVPKGLEVHEAKAPAPSSPWPDGLADFDTLWDFDDPAATEKAFRQLLAPAFASRNDDYLLQLLTQLARAEGLQRRFAEAHTTLDQVLSDLRPELPVARVRYLLERGRVYNSSDQPTRALPLFVEAWHASRAAAVDHLAIDAAHMIAIVDSGDTSQKWNEDALALAESSRDPRARKWGPSLLNNLGWSAFEAGQHARALDLFQRALAGREAEGKAQPIRVARWCVARTLRALKRVSEALQIQQALAAELETARVRDGYVDEEIGENLLLLDRADEARPHFARAWAELSRDPWLVDHEGARLRRIRTLGAVAAP